MRSGSTDGESIAETSAGSGRGGRGRRNTTIADWAEQELARIRATRDTPVTEAEMRDFPAKLEGDRLRYERVFAAADVLPGQVCPRCGEKTPSEKALKMREWRKGKKA